MRFTATRAQLARTFLSARELSAGGRQLRVWQGWLARRFTSEQVAADGNILFYLTEFLKLQDNHLSSEISQGGAIVMGRRMTLFPEGDGRAICYYHQDRLYTIYRDGTVSVSSGDPTRRFDNPGGPEETLQEVVDGYLMQRWALSALSVAKENDYQRSRPRGDDAILELGKSQAQDADGKPIPVYGRWTTLIGAPA